MTCPNCGAEVPPRAKACPECGSCDETGWSETASESGLDLPDENFDYDEYVKREFEGPNAKPRGINWFWWAIAVFALIVFVLLMIR